MKIAIVLRVISFSGAENVANTLVREFLVKGHETHIILTGGECPQDTTIKIISAVANGPQVIRQIKRTLLLKKIIKTGNYDIVVGFGLVNTIHLLRAKLFTRFKVVGAARMDPILYPTQKLLRLERYILYRCLDGMIVQTTMQKQYFDRIIKRGSIVIPNPVREVKIESLPIDMRKKKCVTIARLENKQKNHLFMLECFKEFVAKNPEYELDFYGAGPDKKLYEEYVNQHQLVGKVYFRGYSKNPQEDICDAEMFLLTSNHEGMPNALIEAMSMGIPSISIDCGGGGPRDLIQDGENGFLVQKGDKEGFVKRMDMLAKDKNMRSKISIEAIKINDKLEKSHIAEQWILALDSMSKS